MKGDRTQAEAERVGVQPGKGELVRDGEQHQCVGVGVPLTHPIGVPEGELESRVGGLTGLSGR